jgi:hypothetical protein
MPTLHAAKGVFVTGSDSLQHVGGVGFQPAVVIAWWTRQENDGIVLGNRGGMGFWAAEPACAAVAWASDDGAIPTATARVHDAAALLGLDRAGDGVAMRATVASFDADGFTLAWDVQPTAPWTVHYLALGGPAVTDARVGWVSAPTSPGRQTVPLDRIDPDLVLFLPTAASVRGASVEGLSLGIGAVAGKRQAAAGFVSRNGADAGDVGGAQRTDAAIMAVADRAALSCLGTVSVAGAEVAIDWVATPAEPIEVPYLAVEGVRARVGAHVSPTEPGSRATRGVGFRPDALLLLTWGLHPSTEPTDIGRLCLGGATSPATCGCAGWDDRDTDARPANTHVSSSTRDAVVVTNTQTGGVHAAASLRSIDDDGFTLDWHTSDGFRREVVFVALAGREPWRPADAARRWRSRLSGALTHASR